MVRRIVKRVAGFWIDVIFGKEESLNGYVSTTRPYEKRKTLER